MKKCFSLFLILGFYLMSPLFCQADTIVLTDTSPNFTVPAGKLTKVYGTASSNQITLASGAQAEIVNFPGSNAITILSDSSLFTVFRSGATVTFQGSDETILKIPATVSIQTISFNDQTLGLYIENNQVMLDGQQINLNPVAITVQKAESQAIYYLLDENADERGTDVDGDGVKDLLANIHMNGLAFMVDTITFVIEFDQIMLTNKDVITHVDFVAALQPALQALIDAGQVPADITLKVDPTMIEFTFLDDGSRSSDIPAIVLETQTNSTLTPLGFLSVDDFIGEYDVYVRFYSQSQEAVQKTESQAIYYLLDENADMLNTDVDGDGVKDLLANINTNGLIFTVDLITHAIEFDQAMLINKDVITHVDFVAALQPALQALIDAGQVPADTTLKVDPTMTQFTFLDDGSRSSDIPAIVFETQTSTVHSPVGFLRVDDFIGEYDVYGRVDIQSQETVQKAESQAIYYLLDENADERGTDVDGDGVKDLLANIHMNGLVFMVDTITFVIEFDQTMLTNKDVITHVDFVAALQPALQALIDAGQVPADITLKVDPTMTEFTFLDDGSRSSDIPAIVLETQTNSTLTPLGFLSVDDFIGEYDVYGRWKTE